VQTTTQNRKRVLVVDDDLDTAHSTVRLVRLMGHEAEFAINGIAALAVAQRFRPQVIVLDIGLPDSHGWEVARQLRKDPQLNSARIIALTGRSQLDDASRSKAAGCDEHLRKPLDPQVLERILEAG
jgi:two-component system CheB/CheR fusion protein